MSLNISIINFFEKYFLAICVFLFLLFSAGGFLVYKKHQSLNEALNTLDGHYARMEGAERQESEIRSMLTQVQGMLAAQIVGSDGSQAGNQVLQEIRKMLSDEGLIVTSSQTKTPELDGSFLRTDVLITAEGELPSIYRVLNNHISAQRKYKLDNFEISLKGNLQSLNPEVTQILIVKMSISFIQKGSQ